MEHQYIAYGMIVLLVCGIGAGIYLAWYRSQAQVERRRRHRHRADRGRKPPP